MRCLEAGGPHWPRQVADLDDHAPDRLWVAGSGSLRLLALRSVAIVGARNASAYGITQAAQLAADLGSSGWAVVSGAAFGIDAAAHRGALAAGAATVAVMAGGADVPVPQGNAGLLAQIADHGVITSEYDPGTPAQRHTFLERNRIIAALARATIVVEAGWRSGSLNTAEWAAILGRPVLAVPGPASADTSRGTHHLIRTGAARLVTDADDVLAVLREGDGV